MTSFRTWLTARWGSKQIARQRLAKMAEARLDPKLLVVGGTIKTPARKWR